MSAGDLFTFARKGKYWNDLYERPASLFEHTMVQRRDRALRYICEHFGKDAKVLDLGCGAGVLSEKLLERGYTLTAADLSTDMLSLAARRLRRFPAGTFALQQADCLDLPFEDGQFDLVVCLGVFGYFDEVTRALGEIRRVLRPGGTFLMSVRNANQRYLINPVQLAKLPYRILRRLVAPRSPAAPRASGDDGFRIEIYDQPGRLIKGVTERGYDLAEFDGLGYGPLSFGSKKLPFEPISIWISDALDAAFRVTGLRRVSRWVADVSLYAFRRRV